MAAVNAAWPAHPHFVMRLDGADGVVVGRHAAVSKYWLGR